MGLFPEDQDQSPQPSPHCRRVTQGLRECQLCPPDLRWPGLVSLVT